MSKVFSPGQIVIVQGGKYDGNGAKVAKVNTEKGTAEVIISGRIVVLKLERLEQLPGGKNE